MYSRGIRLAMRYGMRDSAVDDLGQRNPADTALASFAPLGFREYHGCTVMPYRRSGKYDMGVFDASGSCIPESLLRRTYMKGREWTSAVPSTSARLRLNTKGRQSTLGC